MRDLEDIIRDANGEFVRAAIRMLYATVENYNYIAPRRDWYHEGVSHLS